MVRGEVEDARRDVLGLTHAPEGREGDALLAHAGPGVDSSLIGTVTRKDGTHQVTYGGWPLYHFESDTKAGDLTGQGNTGFGAVWWVVAPNGEPLPSS